jgi:cytochrome c553
MDMKTRQLLAASYLVVFSAFVVAADEPSPEAKLNAERIAIGACASCHGPRGNSYSPKFPQLAGQHANYLAAQLRAFKAQIRGDADAIGYMYGMAAPLDDSTINALADYYAAQAPRLDKRGDAALIAKGKDVYANGIAADGIPPCNSCHGPNAEGSDQFPRLAGQHVQYLLKQLRSFQNNMRDVAVMHGIAQSLKEEDMRAVAIYLQAGP